jgi:peptide/nickel transport system substrate-binding protein
VNEDIKSTSFVLQGLCRHPAGEFAMHRRQMLKLAGSGLVLAVPRIARAQRARTLKYVPVVPLAVLDPVWGANYLTRTHAQMIFDTLYGLDQSFVAHPQMAAGHTVENDGTLWTIRLREGQRFHDGAPVLARDAVASIRRFAARDGFGQALMAATAELSSLDDRTLQFRLARPFPHLPAALAGSSTILPCIMPERLASTDPFTQVTEMIGSGPYRFLPAEFSAGTRACYERFSAYVPHGDEASSYTAGPKVAHFDRIESIYLGDSATSVAALLKGEVDWLDRPPYDQLPLLVRDRSVTVGVRNTAGAIGIMRFNQLYPPFDNPAIRRALLGAVNQADVMTVLVGADRTRWKDRVGLYGPGSPLANEAGVEAMGGPCDYPKVTRDLAKAGYRGERIVVLGVTGTGNIAPMSEVGVDQLRKAGMNIDLQVMDAATMSNRVLNRETRDKGGWDVHFNLLEGLFNANPATNYALRGDGKTGLPGWPVSPGLEASRAAWLDTADFASQKRISEQMQMLLWQDVPYIPLGHWVPLTAHRRDLVDLPWGFPQFYGVRRV